VQAAQRQISLGVIEELLGARLEIKPRILMGLAARDSGDALHEIKDALCRVRDYAE
jgi:hypothetical protein